MAAEVDSTAVVLPESLDGLTAQIAQSSHLLASTGQAELSALALQATKDIFELGLSNEPRSHPHLHPFLVSILQPPSISLRSKSKSNANGADDETEAAAEADPTEVLPYTPLTELTTSGLDHEQIWAQLELRADGIVKVVKEVGPGDQPDLDNSDIGLESDEEDDEDDEDDSGEEMTEEEWERMMQGHGRGDDSDSDEDEDDVDDDDEGSDDGSDEDEEGDSDDEENMIRWKDEEGEGSASGSGSGGESEDDEDEEDEEEDSEDDNEDVSDELGSDEDIDMDALGSDEEAEEDGDDDKAALFGTGDGEDNDDDDDMPGPSSRRKRHPTLDDDFFSIDEFNRITEEAEAGRVSGGRLGGEEDEDEDDLGDVGAVMLQAGPGDDDDIMYNDFFDTPRELRRAGKPPGRKDDGGKGRGKGKGKEQDKKGKGKGKSKGVSFEEDEEMDVDAEEEDDDDVAGDGREVIGRFKGDLFDSDDEDDGEGGQKPLSTHEKQQLELAKQIAELEGQAIGPKDWTLLGEATSRARPENSLLEEDLDFEQVAKVVPVITEERVQSLEDMIKKRIIDNNFDSTVRVRAYEPTAFLPSRYLELQDTQSTKSLAQIYEDEYTAAASGTAVRDPRDEKLRKEHEEIERIWGEVCYKLDALSSLNFVPKAPKAQITTVENLPTTSLESALPPTAAATTLLAPEEMFAPPTSRDLVARSEQTPEEAHAARAKRRREKKAERTKLGEMAELYGKKRPQGGVKGEKERALAGLVKTGKGVTVLGKGEKERGKAAKRAAGAAGTEDREGGKRLKL